MPLDSSKVRELDKIVFPAGGKYLWGALAGDAQRKKRQAVMAALGQKLPQSKCGYNAVHDALVAALEINADRHSIDADLVAALTAGRYS